MKRILGLVLLVFAGALSAAADAPRALSWGELTLRLPASENPFAALAVEQLEALVDVAAVRDRRARGVTSTPQELASERAALARLREAKIDVDGLLAQRDRIAARQGALAGAVNPSLDGQFVRIPGYLVPLEFSGKKVTEFLLVPWAGACIHTPPPPPNQIVHVKADTPFEIRGSFDAVWVTGRIATRAVKKSVYITDGTSEVDIGYSLRATQVEAYK